MKISAEIKEFLNHAGKVLIFEENEPAFVIAKFRDYMELVHRHEAQDASNLDTATQTSQKTERQRLPDERQRQIQEVNRELEAIAQEDFFSPLATLDEHLSSAATSQRFYREVE